MYHRAIVLSLVLACCLAPPCAWPPSALGAASPQLSHECGECHREIYRMWRSSAHAQSMEDPVFLDAVRETESSHGAEVTKVCIRCHAPSTDVTKDSALALKSTWEGVSCDVCHATTGVQMASGGPRLVLDPGPTKRGPIRDAQSIGHEAEFSPLHATSEICAPCHEYANAEGTPLLTTYSEWLGSAPAQEGKTCQSCHMGRTDAAIVDPRVARVPDAQVNLHEVPGGHSIDMLNRALAVDLELLREGGTLLATVSLVNRGAGHSVPTGMPGRRVILEASARSSDGTKEAQQRVFGATFVDAAGGTIATDGGYFAKGVRKTADTRLQSGAQWAEVFRFPVAPTATAYVALRLHYEHHPLGPDNPGTRITFYSTDRMSTPERSSR